MKRRVRGGEENEKVMSPIFSRLHVNETEKGGLRGPPRIMALYDQFSSPVCSITMLPPANNNSSSLVSSTSWSDVSTVIKIKFNLHFYKTSCNILKTKLDLQTVNIWLLICLFELCYLISYSCKASMP